ncbi:mitogen-activated protein kinase kinase kinase 20 [Daucus carota subsp. sativus]|nr:PREDICTED: mitogen-activated protein kinase kinase kinase YODA-like [Daucus carota subsp. sativus]
MNKASILEWEKLRFLGEGLWGSVYLAKIVSHSSSSIPSYVALKLADANSSSTLQLEKTILDDLKGCPQIVQCFGCAFSVENGKLVYNLLLEYANGGTLEQLMEVSGDRMQEFEVSKFTYMLLKGLCHVHHKGYVHGDIKPDNILVFVTKQEDGEDEYSLKIADFGLAKSTSCDNAGEVGIVGVDIWALGSVVAEMLVGKSLWCSNVQLDVMLLIMCKESVDKWLEILPEFLSREAKDFLRRCMTMNKNDRWTGDRLLRHPFITQFHGTSLCEI